MNLLDQERYQDSDPPFAVLALEDSQFARVVTDGLSARPQAALPPDHPTSRLELYSYLTPHPVDTKRALRVVGGIAENVVFRGEPFTGLDTVRMGIDERTTFHFALLDVGVRAQAVPHIALMMVLPLVSFDYHRARSEGLRKFWNSLPPASHQERCDTAWRTFFEAHFTRPAGGQRVTSFAGGHNASQTDKDR